MTVAKHARSPVRYRQTGKHRCIILVKARFGSGGRLRLSFVMEEPIWQEALGKP